MKLAGVLGLGLARAGSVFEAIVASGSTLLDDLVSYWTLDEQSGTRADAVGGNDLTDNNTVGSSLAGPSGTVASFVGANSESLSKSTIDLSSTSFAVNLWVKPTTVAFAQMLVTHQTEAYPATFMCYEQDNGAVTFIAGPDNLDKSTASAAAGSLVAGQWANVYIQWNASTKKAGIAINGGTLAEGDATTAAITSGDHPFRLGARSDGNYLNALESSVGLWSRVLDASERTSLFNSGIGKHYADLTTAEKVGLVSYWNLDEASGTRVDAHGANDLTDNNTVLSTINAPPALDGAAASFVAANTEYLSRTDASIIDGGSDFTVNLWINANNVTGGKGVIGKWNTDGWMVYLNGGTLRLYNGASNFNGDTISAGQWYMITAWVSGTDGYIAVNNGTPVTADFTSLTPAAGTIPFNIGNYSSGGELWDGQMDEPAIWSRVLTADERAELFALGKGKFYDFS